MVTLAEQVPDPARFPPLRGMFEARKRVFVDLLKWDVPVLDGRYEVDQFDDDAATYLIVAGCDGDHGGSARLLRTTRPHILDSLFPELCAASPPRGHSVLEITSEVLTPRRRHSAQCQDRVAEPERKGPMQTAVRDASRPSGFLSPEDLNRAVPQFPAVLAYDILRLRGVPREKQLRGGLRAGSA